MEITVSPTNRYTTYRGVEMRIWEGTDPNGDRFEALIHALVRPGGWDTPPDGMLLVLPGRPTDFGDLSKIPYSKAVNPAATEPAGAV